MDSLKQYAPATQRNREPILEVLLRVLPKSGNILEIASGTGEHSLFFAPAFSPRQWIPSDPNPMARDSIEAWRKDSFVDNIQPNLNINAASLSWGIEEQELNITTIDSYFPLGSLFRVNGRGKKNITIGRYFIFIWTL